MNRFKSLNDVYEFLEENYDWTILYHKEGNPYIKIQKPDNEIELIHKENIEKVALEMWKDTKNNDLDKSIAEEMEQHYFK